MTVHVNLGNCPYIVEVENGTAHELAPQLRAAMAAGKVIQFNEPAHQASTFRLINLAHCETVIVSDSDLVAVGGTSSATGAPLRGKVTVSRLEDLYL